MNRKEGTMDFDFLSRRDFNRLSMAALGGAVAGALIGGCKGKEAQPPGGDALLLSEPHVCRGLNTCKGTGAGGGNNCAGMGNCATAKAHACAGQNDCKGQSGCGEHPGQNACKGMGKCAVPLSDKAWANARRDFELAMRNAGKQFGAAPAKR
jgi:hypothetical protein